MENQNSQITYREIMRQPEAFSAINQNLPTILSVLDHVFSEPVDELIFTGCGTSFYLAQSAAFMFAGKNQMGSSAVPCSELYYFPQNYIKPHRKTLVVPITRKSYTTEVRMAIDKVRQFPNVKSLSITCDADSATYNDFMIHSPNADEKSVIMTSSYSSMLYLAAILADYAAGRLDSARLADYPEKARTSLMRMDEWAQKIITENQHLNLYVMLGQGVFYGVANECMNKIKEMGIACSEGYYTLEYRHGPMSLADEKTFILALTDSATRSFDYDLQKQMQTFGSVTAALGDLGGTAEGCHYQLDLELELEADYAAPIISFVGQLIGYQLSLQKNINADQPRNLSQAIVLPG